MHVDACYWGVGGEGEEVLDGVHGLEVTWAWWERDECGNDAWCLDQVYGSEMMGNVVTVRTKKTVNWFVF